MHVLPFLFLTIFVGFAAFFIMIHLGMAFFKSLFWIITLPFKILIGFLGLLLWLLFLPLKILLLFILGITGLFAIPIVASILFLLGLLWIAC